MALQRVLIADDEKILRSLMADIFCHNGFETVVVEDGLQVLAVLGKDTDFVLVVSDIQMPRMDGITLLQKLRQTYPYIPVLITSVHTSAEVIEIVENEGAVYLPRPFTARQFMEAARRAISKAA
ncbi:MAG: response regulator [Chloroflexi bacterium]|nr:response regulator [Chloroflexota bacterium]